MQRTLSYILVLLLYAAALPAIAAEQNVTGWINAKDKYGLVGDGVADDTAGIQKMFRSHRTVFLPKGTYRITKTINALGGTHIQGGGGGWNPKGQSTILYDGREGGIALSIANCAFFSMENVTVHGNKKAGVGIYWMYTIHGSYLKGCSIIRTLKHGLYVTKTWSVHFNQVCARDNYGCGITFDRGHDKSLAKGAVNHVTLFECKSTSNGKNGLYDGDTVVNTGYGFGSFGCNSVINVLACTFEGNGGAGIYLAGHPCNMHIQGTYLEHNCKAIYRRFEKLYGSSWQRKTDREPLGRIANIIEDTDFGQWSVVFDNVYCHPGGGVWLRGLGKHNAIEFRNLIRPVVIWAEHGNWVVVNSPDVPLAGRPGLIIKGKEGEDTWSDPIPGPSGHPGYTLTQGVRRLYPYSEDGLDLFVNTDTGNDRNDGRAPDRPWKSLAKAGRMFSNTTLDTPATIHLAGSTHAGLALANIQGSGRLTVACDETAVITNASANNVTCQLTIDGNDKLTMQTLVVMRCPDIEVRQTTFAPAGDTPALVAEGSSGVVIVDSHARGAGPRLAARRNSRIFVDGAPAQWPGVVETGSEIGFGRK